ncbi:tetratricopeptide repeat protein [Pedobacter changchengzhani]|uniref:Tetratricopeptide repeat protein n=1 Tax=Pedobacter changchengzhani TaxID=2529274 RepID=A0A4R5MNE2_9SPHI|nr:tetratricopeptide repeat protein [Pedobacter changchengzhani]TDG37168.1 tetratricopeptide repeat protein [Pedobacter changchengzhani]
MSNNIKLKQILIIGAILLLVVFLFTRNIKGLVKPTEENGKMPASGKMVSGAPTSPTATISIDNASEASKSLISKDLSIEIVALENKYKTAKGEDKVSIAKQLAEKWNDVEQITPSALYLEVIATAKPSLQNWLTTGNRFMKAFDGTQDSLAQPILLQKANTAYTNALAIDTSNVEAKTGLGVTIVNGLGAPMQGIAMLLGVVAKDPKNVKANMSLGLFSIKSGQFAKAIPRFNTVIENAPTPEAYFYLGTALENLGRNKEAVEVYLKSKKLAANPTLSAFIDKRIAELKNKN